MSDRSHLLESGVQCSEIVHATDDEIEKAVMVADPMAARGLLYQLTGDAALESAELSTVRVGFLTLKAIESPEDLDLIRTSLTDFLKSYRDRGAGELSFGPRERLPQSLALTCGEDVPVDEVEMWVESLALDPWARGVTWVEPPPSERLEDFAVVVIGAGIGGLNAAAHLRRLGIDFTVLERNPGVGGVWYENRYPGCRVDTLSRTYTHLFGIRFPLKSTFREQTQNEKYLNWVADTTDVRRSIEFGVDVRSVVWDDDEKLWSITGVNAEGSRTWLANAVINATGIFSTPNIPEFEGADAFGGVAVHTARWPDRLDLTGKRVAVIGTGCTGYQMFPEVAKVAAHAYLFQRQPNWVFDTPGYLDDFPPEVAWLDRNVPYYTNFLRFRQAWLTRPAAIRRTFERDLDYPGPGPSALNDTIRSQRLEFIRSKLGHRPELMEKMIPEAPPMSARPIRSDVKDGIYDALLRDNVTLVTEPIERLTENTIVTADGTGHPVDVVVYATGFRTSDLLWQMDVRGRDGRRLEDLWAEDGARAYLGTMLPGFPNFFMLYGPNTNPIGGLGLIDAEEITTRFALMCISYLIEHHKTLVDVTDEAYRRYNDRLDEADQVRIYHDPRAHNYFTTAQGRTVINNPFDGGLMWRWLRDPRASSTHESVSPEASFVRPYIGGDLGVA